MSLEVLNYCSDTSKFKKQVNSGLPLQLQEEAFVCVECGRSCHTVTTGTNHDDMMITIVFHLVAGKVNVCQNV